MPPGTASANQRAAENAETNLLKMQQQQGVVPQLPRASFNMPY
jgi:hypothetical protein